MLTFQSLIVALLFSFIGLFHLLHSIKLWKHFGAKHNFINSFIASLLWIVGGVCYLILYPTNNLLINTLSLIVISLIAPLTAFLFISRGRLVINHVDFTPLTDLRRKSFHLIPPLLIVLLLIIGGEYGLVLILTIGYAGLFFVELIDFARQSFIYNNSLRLKSWINKLISNSLKPQELFEPLKTAPLILSLIPILFFPLSVFSATAFVSSISDGFASVIGHFFGNKRFSNGKSLNGYLAGFIVSFIIIFSCFYLFNTSIINSFLLSIIGSTAFLLIDIYGRFIDDNFLNPIIIGFLLGFVNNFLH